MSEKEYEEQVKRLADGIEKMRANAREVASTLDSLRNSQPMTEFLQQKLIHLADRLRNNG